MAQKYVRTGRPNGTERIAVSHKCTVCHTWHTNRPKFPGPRHTGGDGAEIDKG